jgi:predicted esterase
MDQKTSLTVDPSTANPYRKAYLDGIERCIKGLNREAQIHRRGNMDVSRQEHNRSVLKSLLGMALFENAPTSDPILTEAGETDLAKLYHLTVFVTPEIPFYALLQIPKGAKSPLPLIVAQHGGGGTPELCSDLCGKNNYNGMVRRCLQRGAAVLAPQLLLWSLNETETMRGHDIPFDRTVIDSYLRSFGSTITGLEITGISRCLDYVSSRTDIDSERIGMVGLSYGGYFTLHTMAVEQRIKAGYSAGAFNSRDAHCLSDWCYPGAAYQLQDAEIASLCAPRKLYLQVGMEDTVFDYRNAIAEAEQAKDYYRQLGAEENIRFDVWPGGHTLSNHDLGFDFLFSSL